MKISKGKWEKLPESWRAGLSPPLLLGAAMVCLAASRLSCSLDIKSDSHVQYTQCSWSEIGSFLVGWNRVLPFQVINCQVLGSVADPGCLSRIADPDFYPSRIPDLGSKTNKREGWKKICCHTFFRSHKFHKIVNILCLKCWRKKIWPNFQRMIELFTPKNVKIWVWDPGSRGQKGTGSRIRNTGFRQYIW